MMLSVAQIIWNSFIILLTMVKEVCTLLPAGKWAVWFLPDAVCDIIPSPTPVTFEWFLVYVLQDF